MFYRLRICGVSYAEIYACTAEINQKEWTYYSNYQTFLLQ